MRPAFSNALYYPSIDIYNTDWLKTALLFWDTISTIVPESIEKPYQSADTEYLSDIGFLRPLVVNSRDRSVIGIEAEVLSVLFSTEFQQVQSDLSSAKYRVPSRLYWEKISDTLQYEIKESLYSDKMSWAIRDRVAGMTQSLKDDSCFTVRNDFAYIYMTILANKLCEDHSLAMITDDSPCFSIGNISRYGNQTTLYSSSYSSSSPFNIIRNFHHCEPSLNQGLLLDLIISGISIAPNTDLQTIVKFKEAHKDELGRFRTELARLTQRIPVNGSTEEVQSVVQDLYINEFLPAYEALKSSLSGFHIMWRNNTFLKVAFFSASASSLPVSLLGMNTHQAILAGAGISLIASTISYREEKRKLLRENPYSYLLSVKREW